jgi:GT2 family glycosyltransferase
MAPCLDVVIVSYRCREHVLSCLSSLRRHPARSDAMQTWLVDNASGDGTTQLVAVEFPDVELLALERNVGFSAANNLAIARGSADYVLALNPDTEVTEGALDRLLGLMEGHPEVAIAGPRLVRADGTLDHAAKRSFPTIRSAVGHFSGIGRRADARGSLAAYRAPSTDEGPVDAVNGACMLIRRSALEEVGMFDEGFWMYMEDLDLCYRLARASWVTWYDPVATVLHVKGGSSGARRGVRLNYAFHYGMFRFYRKHYAPRRHTLVNVGVYLGIGTKLVGSVARNALLRRLPARSLSAST